MPLFRIRLALVQVTAWGRAPWYLCVSSGGTVCIALGTNSCDCCRHESAADSVHGCSFGCDHHEHSASDVGGLHQESQAAGDARRPPTEIKISM